MEIDLQKKKKKLNDGMDFVLFVTLQMKNAKKRLPFRCHHFQYIWSSTELRRYHHRL